MEQLKMNEREQRIYNELFHACDVEGNQRVSGQIASKLFISSGLSHETLHQISFISGAKKLGYFGRNEFYTALKLIAAVQAGLPAALESIHSAIDLPIPKFKLHPENKNSNSLYSVANPPTHHYRSSSYTQPVQNNHLTKQQSPVFPVTANEHTPTSPAPNNVPAAYQPSPPVAPAMYHQPIPAPEENPSNDKKWTLFYEEGALTADDSRNQWTHFTDSSSKADTSSLSSESESMDDVWSIDSEQRNYYVNQFQSMQPNLNGTISGPIAKEFFEKSRLPTLELSKVWTLSDVNKDGQLDLEEFCTAMHLVVLRRNKIELPDQLPPSLIPHVSFYSNDEPFALDLPPGSAKRTSSESLSEAHAQGQWIASTMSGGVVGTTEDSSSAVSTPSQKPTPVNFEFKPICADSDSRIAHPVAVRLSPDGLDSPTESGEIQGDHGPMSRPPIHHSTPQHPRPRPVPAKTMSMPMAHGVSPPTVSLPMASYTSSQDHVTVAHPLDGTVPVPPPRMKTHSRSSSLDSRATIAQGAEAPPVAPRKSRENVLSGMSTSLILTGTQSSGDSDNKPVKSHAFSQEKADLRKQIKAQREKNLTLKQLNSELNQELQEVMEQRIALEIQLDHLRPYYDQYF